MTKSELREKWSKYCDTDNLVDNMMALLSKYSHDNSEHGVCVLLDNYFTEKEPLIKLITSSKNYIGDMRIATLQTFDRVIDQNEVYNAVTRFLSGINRNNFFQFADDKGNTLFDYLPVGKTSLKLDDLPSESEQKKKKKNVQKFNYNNFATQESVQRKDDFYAYMEGFKYLNYAKLQKDMVAARKGSPLLKAGTKTSRAFNKICHHYGVDKFDPQTVVVQENGESVTKTVYPYDKLFAAYADVVSDLVRQMHFIISVNPLDYLTMSIGVNWKSCHGIAHGGWRGGCLSYMLDSTSMITYVVTDLNGPIHEIPKVYRQMFHYDNGLFMQNRLYPQGNDGATNLYDKFRNFVIEEFNGILNGNGEWSTEIGSSPCRAHTNSIGVHYVDYYSNPDCSIFYQTTNRDSVKNYIMNVGHKGICVRCGKEYSNSSRLCHGSARECIF